MAKWADSNAQSDDLLRIVNQSASRTLVRPAAKLATVGKLLLEALCDPAAGHRQAKPAMVGKLLCSAASVVLPVSCYADQLEPAIYLTFDDGPGAGTPRVLEVLARHGILATFFIIGKRIAGNETTLEQIHAAGHCLGNHSFSHRSAHQMDYAGLSADLDSCSEHIRQVLPDWRSDLYRPPYGHLSLGFLRFALARQAKIVMWSRDSVDFRAQTSNAILDCLTDLQNGDILLFHDECALTATALETLIPYCLDQGFRFARM